MNENEDFLMTQFQLETTEKLTIKSYQDDRVDIALSGNQDDAASNNIRSLSSSFILTPQQIIEPWPYHEVDELDSAGFSAIIEQRAEVVIIGTGKNLCFPDHQALQAFHQAGIGVEVMNTASACRTFNVLVAENRFVIAGLLIN